MDGLEDEMGRGVGGNVNELRSKLAVAEARVKELETANESLEKARAIAPLVPSSARHVHRGHVPE